MAAFVVLQYADRQVKDLKKLVKLLESENTHLKLEIEVRYVLRPTHATCSFQDHLQNIHSFFFIVRPNREEWKKTKKYHKQLEQLLAQNNLRLDSCFHVLFLAPRARGAGPR